MKRAGFQGHIQRCSARFFARLGQGVDFGVRPTNGAGDAFTHNASPVHDDGTHGGIGVGASARASRQSQRAAYALRGCSLHVCSVNLNDDLLGADIVQRIPRLHGDHVLADGQVG